MSNLIEIFTENFKAALASIGIDDYQSEQYVIIPNSDDENCKSMDKIYHLWTTPGFTGIRLSFEAIIGHLVKEGKKVAPLRVKIFKEAGQPILLDTSKRYRKLRDLVQRRLNNPFYPFEILEETEMEFSLQIERMEAIRILFFKRQVIPEFEELIGPEITKKEVFSTFKNHFESYSFYPAEYHKSKPGEESFSSLVIHKEADTNEFSIFKNPAREDLIQSGLRLKEALKIYISEELKNEIYGFNITLPQAP